MSQPRANSWSSGSTPARRRQCSLKVLHGQKTPCDDDPQIPRLTSRTSQIKNFSFMIVLCARARRPANE